MWLHIVLDNPGEKTPTAPPAHGPAARALAMFFQTIATPDEVLAAVRVLLIGRHIAADGHARHVRGVEIAPAPVGDLAPVFALLNERFQGRFTAGEPLAKVLLRLLDADASAVASTGVPGVVDGCNCSACTSRRRAALSADRICANALDALATEPALPDEVRKAIGRRAEEFHAAVKEHETRHDGAGGR